MKFGYDLNIPLFSFLWWMGLFLSLFLFSGLYIVFKYVKYRKTISILLASTLLFNMGFLEVYLGMKGLWSITYALPLQLCDILQVMAILFLLMKRAWLFELLLFLGIIFPLQALLFPGLIEASTFFFISYYFSHTTLVFIPLFFLIEEKMKPRKNSWWKVQTLFFLSLIPIAFIDFLFDANYLFLREEPNLYHPLNQLSWPFYILLWMGLSYLFSWVLGRVVN